MSQYESLILKIKEKKELKDISDSLILDLIENYQKKHPLQLSQLSDKQLKPMIKQIRTELRLYTGRFQKGVKNRDSLFEQNKISELLKTHTSTSERINFYPQLKEKISSLNIKSILDLGCGLNPIALASKEIEYSACDIKESEISLINKFFKNNQIEGNAFIFDLRKIENLPSLPKADLCIIFKVLDILEKENHKIANAIISNLNCKYLLISFSTRKLSGKPMSNPKRYWLEKLLDYNNLSFEIFSSNNEIFYLIRK